MELMSEHHVDWLESRGLDSETAQKLGIYSDRQDQHGHVLVVPIRRNAQIINRQYRDTDEKKFWMEPDAPVGFFNENCLRDDSLRDEPLIITEGPMDMLAAIQAGYAKTVSVPNGADSNLDFITEILDGLLGENEIILAVDRDDAGAKLGKHLLNMFGAVRCKYVNYHKGLKDLNDVQIRHGSDGIRQVIGNAKPYPVPGLYTLSSYPDIPIPTTYSTGWKNLDPHFRLWRGEFAVITGIPGHGKSLFALHLIANLCAIHGHKAAIASFEMPIVPYVRNIFREYHDGKKSISHDWREADNWINEKISFIDPMPVGYDGMGEDPTLDWILERAEAAVIRHGADWLLLDPWNQISHDLDRHGSAEYQRRAIMKVKHFARSYDCGVLVVAHPTKDVKLPNGKVRKPGLYDIDGSAHWYNAADHGVVLDRDISKNSVEIDVKKSRFLSGGKAGQAWLFYEEWPGRYKEIAPPTDYDNFKPDC